MASINENDEEIISTINITPLVDIMLVLLIIFMLVSRIEDFSSIKVELPHAATGDEINNETVSVMISSKGEYYLSGQKLESAKNLMEKLVLKKKESENVQVAISADKKAYHEEIVRVIDIIRKVGINGFAINVEYLEETE